MFSLLCVHVFCDSLVFLYSLNFRFPCFPHSSCHDLTFSNFHSNSSHLSLRSSSHPPILLTPPLLPTLPSSPFSPPSPLLSSLPCLLFISSPLHSLSYLPFFSSPRGHGSGLHSRRHPSSILRP